MGDTIPSPALVRIFVELFEEGTDCLRPVEAVPLGDDLFKIPETTEVAEDEVWRFQPGATVRCKWRTGSGGLSGLHAFEQVGHVV